MYILFTKGQPLRVQVHCLQISEYELCYSCVVGVWPEEANRHPEPLEHLHYLGRFVVRSIVH